MRHLQLGKGIRLFQRVLQRHFSANIADSQQPVDHMSNLQDFKFALEKKSKGDFAQSLYHFFKVKDILEHSQQQKSTEYIRVLRQLFNKHCPDQLRDPKLWRDRVSPTAYFRHYV